MKAGEAVSLALDGDKNEITNYVRRLEEIRLAYLVNHRMVYLTEQRWPDAPFWKARLGFFKPGLYEPFQNRAGHLNGRRI
jgi:hypothetical protein